MRLICLLLGVYATLAAFLLYFFCEHLGYTIITVCQFILVMNEKKQTSSKILMALIVLMFTLQTIESACSWYKLWLGFIYYDDVPDQALEALEGEATPSTTVWLVEATINMLLTLRLAIADSIMVSTCPLLPASTARNLRSEGLEVLDNMQQKLEGCNSAFSLQCCIYRYVIALGNKLGTNGIMTISALGMAFFGLDVRLTPHAIPASIYNTVELSAITLSVVTTVLSTVIIAIRILMVSRMPGASHKLWIAMEIMIESALLYSISALVLIPMGALLAGTESVVTYYEYAQVVFIYMAVESRYSFFPLLSS
jgi:hypothetical protein